MKTIRIYSIVALLFAFLLSGCTLNELDAVFQSYAITVSAGDGGSVSGGSLAIAYNADITLTATPNSGYRFVAWYEDSIQASVDTVYTFTVAGNRSLVAQFKNVHLYAVDAKTVGANFQEGSEFGTVEGTGEFMNNTTVQLLAKPANGYHFGAWYTALNDFNSLLSRDSVVELLCIQDTTLYALFVPNQYDLVITANPELGGSVTGGGSFDYNSVATVSAAVNDGYRFDGFYDLVDGLLSASSPYEFSLVGDREMEARFVKIWTVQVGDDGFGSASINGGGTTLVADDAAVVELNATPNAGYFFAGWYNGITPVFKNNPYSVSVTGNVNLQAHFSTDANAIGAITDWTNQPIDGGIAN